MNDFLSNLERNCKNVYYSDEFIFENPMALCIIPNLSLNGAQTAFSEMLNLLFKHNNYSYCIISPEDGAYRDLYVKMGCLVCIRPNIASDDSFRYLLQHSFEVVILNTVLVHGYSMFFVNTDISVFWWIHEGIEHINSCCTDMPNPNLLSSNIHIYGVSPVVSDAFRNLYNYNIDIMPICIPDEHMQYTGDIRDGLIRFFIPAAYSQIKGQDILLSAISSLPDDYKKRALFEFCGYYTDDNKDYYNKIIELSNKLPCVNHLGILNKHEMYQHYADCDCVIAPSRVDTNPATIIEGMMFHRLTIASDKTGISRYMADCVNGFIFHNVDDLVKRLLLIITDKNSLNPIAERGAEIWRSNFSPESIIGQLVKCEAFNL